jgi:hypothetical protein
LVKEYDSREIEATSVDTRTAATTLSANATPGVLNVPSGAQNLEAAYVTIGCDHAAAGSATGIVRLEGGGLPGGPYVVAFGAAGSESTTGCSSLVPATRIPLGLPVVPGNEVLIAIEMCGEDIGSLHCGVTLVFDMGGMNTGPTKGIITVEGDISDDAVLAALTTQGSTTAPSRQVPSDASIIKTICVACAPDLAAAGAASFMLKLSGKGIKGGEQTIFVAGAGGAAVQSGADPDGLAMGPLVIDEAGIAVDGGDTITIEADLAGDDLGDARMVVTLIFA